MKRSLPFVIIAAVAVLTVGAGAMLYRVKERAITGGGVTRPSTNETGRSRCTFAASPARRSPGGIRRLPVSIVRHRG